MNGHLTRIAVFGAYSALAVAALWAAESAVQELFTRTRADIVDTLKRFPRYVCVQTVERSQYELPRAGWSCNSAVANAQRNAAERMLRWHDRLRLDVAVGEKSEMFSWAGASKFESGDIGDLVSRGASGSGEFGAFLTGIFAGDAERFVYQGLKDLPIGRVATFDFTVPVTRSHYQYATDSRNYATAGYHGSFFVDPATAALRELDIEATEFPVSNPVCRVEDKIEYSKTKIGSDTFLLPSRSAMDVIYHNFSESVNITTFSGCREYSGNSTIRFDVDENGNVVSDESRPELKPLPPKTHLKVKIDPPVDSDKAAAGDPITAVVIAPVKDKGIVVVKPGDKLKGRIVRLEQIMGNLPRWTVAILFETIERSGVEQKISLKPVDDGDRSPVFSSAVGRRTGPPVTPITSERPAGGGIFSFQRDGNLVLGAKFESEWETR